MNYHHLHLSSTLVTDSCFLQHWTSILVVTESGVCVLYDHSKMDDLRSGSSWNGWGSWGSWSWNGFVLASLDQTFVSRLNCLQELKDHESCVYFFARFGEKKLHRIRTYSQLPNDTSIHFSVIFSDSFNNRIGSILSQVVSFVLRSRLTTEKCSSSSVDYDL